MIRVSTFIDGLGQAGGDTYRNLLLSAFKSKALFKYPIASQFPQVFSLTWDSKANQKVARFLLPIFYSAELVTPWFQFSKLPSLK